METNEVDDKSRQEEFEAKDDPKEEPQLEVIDQEQKSVDENIKVIDNSNDESTTAENDLPDTSQPAKSTTPLSPEIPADDEPPTGDVDTNERFDETWDEENTVPPPRPQTPTPSVTRLPVSSPLSPPESMRALQRLSLEQSGSSSASPPTSPESPTNDKHAHQSKGRHYQQVRSKLRKHRERELLKEKGTMAKTKLEDRRIRQRMIVQLRKNMHIPEEVTRVMRRLLNDAKETENEDWSSRIGKYLLSDMLDMWKFQNVATDEYIRMKCWEGTEQDDESAIRFIIGYCRHATGIPSGAGG